MGDSRIPNTTLVVWKAAMSAYTLNCTATTTCAMTNPPRPSRAPAESTTQPKPPKFWSLPKDELACFAGRHGPLKIEATVGTGHFQKQDSMVAGRYPCRKGLRVYTCRNSKGL